MQNDTVLLQLRMTKTVRPQRPQTAQMSKTARRDFQLPKEWRRQAFTGDPPTPEIGSIANSERLQKCFAATALTSEEKSLLKSISQRNRRLSDGGFKLSPEEETFLFRLANYQHRARIFYLAHSPLLGPVVTDEKEKKKLRLPSCCPPSPRPLKRREAQIQ